MNEIINLFGLLTILMTMLHTDCMAPTPSTMRREVTFKEHGVAVS